MYICIGVIHTCILVLESSWKHSSMPLLYIIYILDLCLHCIPNILFISHEQEIQIVAHTCWSLQFGRQYTFRISHHQRHSPGGFLPPGPTRRLCCLHIQQTDASLTPAIKIISLFNFFLFFYFTYLISCTCFTLILHSFIINITFLLIIIFSCNLFIYLLLLCFIHILYILSFTLINVILLPLCNLLLFCIYIHVHIFMYSQRLRMDFA